MSDMPKTETPETETPETETLEAETLAPETPQTETPPPLLMTERAQDAIERFAKQAEKAQTETRGDRRVDTVKRYAAARKALEPRELAILDMTALKRRSLAQLAAQTGQPVDALARLLLAAGERLADHFEG